MRTIKLLRLALSRLNPSICSVTPGVAVLLITVTWFVDPVGATDLKVMKIGLGSGTVSSSLGGISCGTTCDAAYGSAASVALTALPDGFSTFSGWQGDCSGTGACTVIMSANHSVRVEFRLTSAIPLLNTAFTDPLTGTVFSAGNDFTPERIAAYLRANPTVNSAARFIAALPIDYKQNWILMSRSESLQTGTAGFPRILLPSANAQSVFTLGMTTHGSYPGAHPNAMEYMQWDAGEKNFRFHEIVLKDITPMYEILDSLGNPTGTFRFPDRPRGVSVDDNKCSKCHSTRNVLNRSSSPGTTGIPPGTVKAKNKPNWDAYDSWGGMMPFNRDRIYQDSVEAAAFRHIFNLWNWRNSDANDAVRQILEQLELQPPYVLNQMPPSPHRITRDLNNVSDNGHITFGFDSLPAISTTTSPPINYSFGGPSAAASTVTQGGRYVTLRHSNPRIPPSNDNYDNPGSDEGRGVAFFDRLGGLSGNLNAQRIADELINHRFATGSVPVDVRPIALAILNMQPCLSVASLPSLASASSAMKKVDLGFFNARNGIMSIADLVSDTTTRAQSLPRRKADIQKRDLDRTVDPYLFSSAPANGLIQQYGSATSAGTNTAMPRLRQEVFRRPIDLGSPDSVIGGFYVDREDYSFNTERVALLRYFLEPLGVSVDKWSMGVRGRSRTYTFADVFGSYQNVLQPQLGASLGLTAPPYNCAALIDAVKSTLDESLLPPANAVPTYTDVQRILNKSCIECHGGLGYPPYGPGSLDLSEDEAPPATVPPMVSPRLARSYGNALTYTTTDPATSYLYNLITRTDETCPPGGLGMMPCGGPPLSKVDIETIRRWIVGVPGVPGSSRPSTAGDPHIKTVDGTNYDLQSAGEFVLLRDENLEIQVRQTAVDTDGPLAPNPHTGLSSCVSVNTAVAVRLGTQRITYQPNISGQPDPEGLQLRIDGKLTKAGAPEINLASGGRIVRTTALGGIQIEVPGGTIVVITPGWWDYYRLWYLNVEVAHPRATQGVMGAIAPGNWLPALPDGSLMGSRPPDLHQRYKDLYVKFANGWRVGDATSLFDYAPGTSTGTFTIVSWPVEAPRSCTVPRQPGGTPAKLPLKPLALEVAKQHCSGLVAADRRANCEQDVMITGEPGFAKTYLLTEQIERNAFPTAPILAFPEDGKTELAKPITFTWHSATDPDGDHVTYKHCVWISLEKPTFNNCDGSSIETTSWVRGLLYAVLVALLVCLLFALLIFMGMKQRRSLLGLVAIAGLAAVILAFYVGNIGSKTVSKTFSGLESGKAYLWKVIAEDGKGGTTESKTRRLTVK